MAWQDYRETVQKLYVAYYQRPADPLGLRYWAQVINDYGLNVAVNAFVNSPEAQSLYAGDINAVITAVYNSAFGRDPEPEGLAYWINVYNQGWATLGTIVWEIVNGARGSDAIVLENKVTSAMNFTQALDPELDGVGPFQATYSGPSDAAAGRAFLADVDATTIRSIDDARAYIITNIADPGDPISGSTTGNVFNFIYTGTAPVEDKLVGTPFDDLFIGTSNTVQPGDRADGLGGNDTLRLLGFTSAKVTIPIISNIETIEVVGNPATVNLLSFPDVNTLRIRDITKMVTTISAKLATNQTVELINIANAKTFSISIVTKFAGDKTIDVVVDNVVQKVDATNETVTPINLNVTWTGATTLNLTAQNIASDITITGLTANDKLNVSGKADITLNFTTSPTNVWINASENSGTVTVRLDGGVNYAPPTDARLSGVDNFVLFGSVPHILNLANQSEAFTVIGSLGNDRIFTGAGDDTISAGKGNDTINAGAGADTLTGGPGADRFIFANFATADKITDFVTNTDTIYIDIAKAGTNGVGPIPFVTAKTTLKLLTTGGGITTTIGGSTLKLEALTSGGAINLTGAHLFVKTNTAKLVSNIVSKVAGNADARCLAIGRTTLNNKLYLVVIGDTNPAAAGVGTFVASVKTVVTVGAPFSATDIYIF